MTATSYLSWLDSAPSAGHPDHLMSRYLDHLVATGTTPSEIGDQMAMIEKQLTSEPHAWRHIFNNVFKNDRPTYSTRPNAFLSAAVRNVRPGSALDIAMGQGRNALLLARKGWRVTGFDVSSVGVSRARAQASKTGLAVHALTCSSREFQYGVNAWDIIVATYAPLPLHSEKWLCAIRTSLRPGGRIVIETFAPDLVTGRQRPGVELALGDLHQAFAGLDVIDACETTGVADWGDGDTPIVRFLARRPNRGRH